MAATDDPVGRSFGDFRIKGRLGEGGGGVVYIAEQVSLGRDVALKVLPQEHGEAVTNRFLREARIAARLDHPYAAHVYAFGVEPDRELWIAMELVRGTPLDRWLADHGPIPLARFVPLFDRLCEVLGAAHDQGIVHRDIKPANIMVLQRAGRFLPKLLDLGIALATHADATDVVVPAAVAADDESPATGPASVLAGVDSLQLTRAGTTVGTPHYIAPEQWLRASHVDGRADIYSLSLLAYECLTGRVAMVGETLPQLARAHAKQAMPRLPEGFPSELSDVLAKGAAKKPNDRYATTLELAAAVRHAGRLGVEPEQLPQLPEALLDNWLHASPQPIAETLELWQVARAPRQALAAVAGVVTALVRYLALLSLAARLRVGGGDDEVARPSLQALRRGRLTDAQWLELGGALVAPFAERRAAHPMPELVDLLADPGARERLRELIAKLAEAHAGDDAALEPALAAIVARLGAALERATFLLDYPLVVCGARAELWMGPRRVARVPLRPAISPPPADRGVRVVDADGAEVLVLSPLVQCLTPSAGAADELFLLDGEGRGGARLVTWPGAFERTDEELWRQLAARGFVVDAGTRADAAADSPYKGLATFGTADAQNYFGRERESEAFANRLRQGRFLAVVGPSGTGKSSFVLAGVLPRLPETYTAVVFRPSASPRAAWDSRLAAKGLTAPAAGLDAAAHAEALVAQIPDGQTWVFVVDQFEELVTLCADPDERLAFARALLAAAAHASGKVRVVATLRDDFLIAIQQLAPFRDGLSSSLQLLATPRADDLERVITEPARRVGYGFDDTALPARMVAEVIDKPGALALLSFTAAQMWEVRDRQLHQLRAKTYEALGGVGGALAHHAEATLAAMPEDERSLVRELFRHLVTAQGTRAVLSKAEAEELLGSTAAAREVIERWIGARLIVSREALDGGDAIEIIHEALIGAWPRLVGWQREDAESVRVRDALRASARQWDERGKPAGLLWRKEALAEYRAWRPRFAGRLTGLEQAFATASLRDEARARTWRRIATATTLISLAIGFGIAVRSCVVQQRKLAGAWAEQARTAMLGERATEALLYADAAARAGGGASPAIAQILGAAAAQLDGPEHVVGTAAPGLRRLHVSADERRALATGDGPIVVVDLSTSRELARWDLPCPNGALSADGSRALLSCRDAKLRIVEVATGAVRDVPTGAHLDASLAVSDDGRLVAPRVQGDTLSIYDLDGRRTYQVSVSGVETLAFAFSPRGGGAAIAGNFTQTSSTYDGVTVVDDRGAVRWTLRPLPHPAITAVFSPDGSSLALGLTDSSIAMLDVDAQQIRWVAHVHHDYIRSLAFDARGERLLTSGSDGLVFVLDGKTGKTLAEPRTPGGPVLAAAWVPGDRELVVGTDGGAVIRYDAESGQPRWTYTGHTTTVVDLALLVRAGALISADSDGTIWRWPLDRAFGRLLDPGATAVWGRYATQVVATAHGVELRSGAAAPEPLPLGLDHPELAFADFAGGTVAFANDRTLLVLRRGPGGYARAWTQELAHSISSVAVADDGATVAAIDGTGATITYAASGGAELARFPGSAGDYGALAFDTHGRLVVMTSDGELRLYDASTGMQLAAVPAHHGPAQLFYGARPGQFVTAGLDRGVDVWSDADWRAPVASVMLRESAPYANVDAAGRYLTVAEASPTLRTYDLATGQALSIARLPSPVRTAALDPSGTGLLAAVAGGVVDVPTFFAAPPRAILDRLETCRVAQVLDGEQVVPRPVRCAPGAGYDGSSP